MTAGSTRRRSRRKSATCAKRWAPTALSTTSKGSAHWATGAPQEAETLKKFRKQIAKQKQELEALEKEACVRLPSHVRTRPALMGDRPVRTVKSSRRRTVPSRHERRSYWTGSLVEDEELGNAKCQLCACLDAILWPCLSLYRRGTNTLESACPCPGPR